jgi:Tfp pilus assembly protein PilZ
MSEQEHTSSKDGGAEKKQPCLVTYFMGDQLRRGTSMHFNERGILVVCPDPVPLNTKLRLVLQIPGMRNPIEVYGEVVWTNIHGPSDALSPRGMGVKFTGTERETERLLADVSAQFDTAGVSYSCYFT